MQMLVERLGSGGSRRRVYCHQIGFGGVILIQKLLNSGKLGTQSVDTDGCRNYGPFLDPYYNMAPNIQGTQKGLLRYI